MMNRTMGVVVMGVLAGGSMAGAGTVTANYLSVSPGRTIDWTAPILGHLIEPVGIYNFTNATGDIVGDFQGVCIEMQFINPTMTWNVDALENAPQPFNLGGTGVGPMMTTKANYIRELWADQFASIGSDNDKAAAFQIAVWELVYDTDRNLSTGPFIYNLPASDPALVTAQTWLSALDQQGPMASLVALTSELNQDYVVQVVPLPPAIWMGASAMGALGGISAWRRRGRQA